MGTKGSRRTGDAELAAARLVEALSGLGEVSSRKMFGGLGVFEGSTMFGIVDSGGGIYFRAGAANADMFREAKSRQHGKMPYYSVPDAVLADEGSLARWGRAAIDASRAAKKG